MTTVQVEPWSAMLPEAEGLFPLHWRELAVRQDKIKISIDRERYAILEQKNMLHVVTVRVDGRLVGYAVAFVLPHMHYKDAGDMAMTDMYFILPEFRRGAGLKLFLEFERSLKARGVVNAMTSCKVHSDNTEFLEGLGWQWTDKTFCKYLGD